MRRLLASLPSLLLACSTGEHAAEEPAVTPPPTAPIEAEPHAVPETEGPEYFFAAVGQSGVEHCPDGVSKEWLGVRATLGWTSTSGPAEAELDALVGAPVLARGQVAPAPERPPLTVAPQPCPIMQMRSDWVDTPRGIRSRWIEPLGVSHFRVDSVRRLDELQAEVRGPSADSPDGALVVRFTNPLPFALTDVRLQVRYEGCYGKPNTTSHASDTVRLGPGEALEHAFPRIDVKDHPGPRKGGDTRDHAPASIALQIGGSEGPAEAKVWSDLDVSVRDLGLKFECP